jgi:hypothetical protein
LRRLRAESLENRRVLAGAIDTCLPMAEADVPAQESTVPPFGPEVRRDSASQKARPFRLKGIGFGSEGLPLAPDTTSNFSSTGTATGLGRYTGEGSFTLRSIDFSDPAGAVTGTFEGDFVFTAANGDQLAVTFGDGGSGVFTAQASADMSFLTDVKFDAFFSPDQVDSNGRFAKVVGGGWRMIAKTDFISISNPASGVTDPFEFSWSGDGTLDFAKKSK